MCGGAILVALIPRNGNCRVSASDLWPNSRFTGKFNTFPSDLHHSAPKHQQPTVKRAQPYTGDACFGEVKVKVKMKEEEEKQEVRENSKESAVIEVEEPGEEESEVQKLSEELMAFESYMKFYQIPYLEGQSAAAPPNPAQESVVGGDVVELWSFDEVTPDVA